MAKKQKLIEKIDILTDIKNPQVFPWKYKSNSVKEVTCIGVFEFIPGRLRGKFMDEIYRILVPYDKSLDIGKAVFAVAYWNTARGIQDYRYEWPPLCEQSFLYFNKSWRETNKLETDMICDFDFTYGYTPDPETAARNDESRTFYIKHYTNCVDALHLMLTKKSDP